MLGHHVVLEQLYCIGVDSLLEGWLRSGHCEADDLNHDPSWPVDGDIIILEKITLISTEVLFCNNKIIVINFVLVGL